MLITKMYTFRTSNIDTVGFKSSIFETLSPYNFCIQCPNDVLLVRWNPLILQRRKLYKLDRSNGRNCAQRLLVLSVLGITYLTQSTCIAPSLEVWNVMGGSWAIIYMIILQLTEYLLTYPLDSCWTCWWFYQMRHKIPVIFNK